MMSDSVGRFDDEKRSRGFTKDKVHQRDAYIVLSTPDPHREEGEGASTANEVAAFGWLRPLIIPDTAVPDSFCDIDLVNALYQSGYSAETFATGAIQIFGEHRMQLHASEIILPALRDYYEGHPNIEGICVRTSNRRMVSNLTDYLFLKTLVSTESGIAGIFAGEGLHD